MRHFPRFLCALSLILISTPVVGQTGTVSGRLTEAGTQSAVSGAQVEAVGPSTRTVTSATDGRYRISNLPAGEYTLIINMVGYGERRVENVAVSAGQTTVVDAQLSVAAFDLNPIVVSASKRREKALDAPASVEVVPEIQIQQRPVTTPVEHLKGLPGVDVITNGLQSTNVVARGFNNIFSGSLHTLTDYRIASVPSLRVNFMHFIPATNEDLQRMEVVLGPGSALYGPNTANGVLHIITKSPLDDQGTTVSLATGVRASQSETLRRDCRLGTDWCASELPTSLADRSALIGSFRTAHLIGEDLGVKLSGQFFQGQEWLYVDETEQEARADLINRPGVDPDTIRVGRRDFDLARYSFEGRADWQVLDDARASFTAGHSNIVNAVELTGIGAGQASGWSNSFYQARFNKDRLFGQVYLNASDAGDTYLLRSGDPIIDHSKLVVGQLQHGRAVSGGRHNVTYGVDLLRTMPNTAGTIHGANEDADEVTEFGVYLQTEIGLAERFEIVLAGRSDWHSHVDQPVLSPRAALVYKPAENHNLRLTYNRAFSTPSTLNLFLDLDAGAAPPPLGLIGYRVRAQGTGESGYTFMNEDGTLRGVRSPFTDGQFAGALDNPDNFFYAAPTAKDFWTMGVGALYSRQGLSPAEAEALAALSPNQGAIDPFLFDLNTQTLSPISAGVPGLPGIEESYTQTFEVGYKGIVGERLLIAADMWHERRNNFVSPLVPVTPLVVLDSAGIANFIKSEGVTTDARAEQIAKGMSGLPIAVVSSPEINAEGADIMATYVNFGNVQLTGADLTATYLLNDRWRIGVGGSWVSDDYFITEGQLIALNAPDVKGTGRIEYRNPTLGLNGELRARYTSEFPVNSAPFAATQCIAEIEEQDALPSGSISEPCIQPFTILDLVLGYDLPWARGASLQMVMNNVTDTPYRSFAGVPTIGRFTMIRLRYEF